MPKPQSFTSRTRETQDLHADWWSSIRTPDGILKKDSAGNITSHICEEGEAGRYVERVVIYAQQFGADTQAIQARALRNVNLQRVGEPKSAQELARSRMYTFQRMVVEVTDEDGNQIQVNDAFMTQTPECDLAFIEKAIQRLAESPLEPTEEDKEAHSREAEKFDQLEAQGYPEHLRHLRNVEEIAENNFR